MESACNQLPYADRPTFKIIGDSQVMLLKFINEEIDLFGRCAGCNIYESLRAQEASHPYKLRLSGPSFGPAF